MLKLNDGRNELWQWDTGRKLAVDAECSEVHFSNKVYGRSIDVAVIDGTAAIPDILLQVDKELYAWGFVGTPENGYTKISKVFRVNRRNKPSDYVFTPPEQINLAEIMAELNELKEVVSPEKIGEAVNEYLKENPIDAEEIGAVAQNQGKENAGKILGIDASGEVVPVDAVDMASGGEEVWVPLVDITLEEETNIIDTGTFPTPQKKIRVELNTLAAETNTNYMPVTIPTGDDGSTAFSAIKFYPAPMPITTAARSFYEIECIGDETVVVGVYYSGNTTGFDTGIARLQEFVGAAKTTLSQIDAYGNRYQNQITGFKVLTYAKFAVGTQLKIWGVVK